MNVNQPDLGSLGPDTATSSDMGGFALNSS